MMDNTIYNRIRQLAETRATDECLKDYKLEAHTRRYLIDPFIKELGYDIDNPKEFEIEYTADIGNKKGEKIDAIIKKDNQPIILIEAKHWKEAIINHTSQLYRYYHTLTGKKIGLLTNCLQYAFYADIEEVNKMDKEPFFTIDIRTITETQARELEQFTKDIINPDTIISRAERLKIMNDLDDYWKHFMVRYDEEIVTLLARKFSKSKSITQKIKDQFKEYIPLSFQRYLSTYLNEHLKRASLQQKEQIVDIVQKEHKAINTTHYIDRHGVKVYIGDVLTYIKDSNIQVKVVAIKNNIAYVMYNNKEYSLNEVAKMVFRTNKGNALNSINAWNIFTKDGQKLVP